MTRFTAEGERPIYNAQVFLRAISQINSNVSRVIPDGIFGAETAEAVRSFQGEYGLAVTGEIDNETWDKIIEVYTDKEAYMLPPEKTQLFPVSDYVIREGDRGDFLYAVQAVIYALAKRFENIDVPSGISDLYDSSAANSVRQLQAVLGLPCDGELDVKCWGMISRLYESSVVAKMPKNAFELGQAVAEERIAEENEFGAVFVQRGEIYEQMRRETETENGARGIIAPKSNAAADGAEAAEVKKEVLPRVSGEKPKLPPLKWSLK